MKHTNELYKNFLEKTFEELNIDYEYLNLQDKDINFLIKPSIPDYDFFEEVYINIFLYFTPKNNITLYNPIIYKLGESDSLIYTLNCINDINNKIPSGKIYLSHNNINISYINQIILNNILEEFTPSLCHKYISSYIMSLILFYQNIKGIYQK